MCGRLNCYCKYSSYSDRVAKKLEGDPPEWIDPLKFRPSPNIAPTLYLPVLHVGESGQLVVSSMKWGVFLPHVQSTLHNVRIETLSKSNFFQNLLARKQTCAVLCDGFYEWKDKNPFFFYDGQTGFDESKITEWSEEEWIEKGPPVMALAGVFHKDADYTCSLITKQATPTSKKIHHRIAILLSSKDEILTWLSSETSVSAKLSLLNGIKNETLSYYEVNGRVNSSRYQGNDCHVPKSKGPPSGPLGQGFSRSKDVSGTPPSDSSLQETAPEKCSSNKRKSTSDFPSSQKKSARLHKSQAGTSRKSVSSSSAENKSGGTLDRWFSITKKPPE